MRRNPILPSKSLRRDVRHQIPQRQGPQSSLLEAVNSDIDAEDLHEWTWICNIRLGHRNLQILQ